jgi:hypothetical protein
MNKKGLTCSSGKKLEAQMFNTKYLIFIFNNMLLVAVYLQFTLILFFYIRIIAMCRLMMYLLGPGQHRNNELPVSLTSVINLFLVDLTLLMN